LCVGRTDTADNRQADIEFQLGRVEFPDFRVHTGRMLIDWNEKLRCPKCHKTGMASLHHGEGDDAPTVESVPEGFKVVMTPHGPDFYCGTCNVPAEP
jgi:ribosomal protein S27AE